MSTSAKSPNLTPYQQGRYLCIYCGEFNLIATMKRYLKKRLECPQCKQKAGLRERCTGMTRSPVFGVTMPRPETSHMPGSWYDRDGNHRAKRRVGRPRKHDVCNNCNAEVFVSVTTAESYADNMAIQHGKVYEPYACPHGNGVHVQLID